VYVSASSATGLMEGAVRNGARRRVLSLVNGAFSERFFQIAKATGLARGRAGGAVGRGPHAGHAGATRCAGGDYDAVTVVHSETSTGALNPIARAGRPSPTRRRRRSAGGQRVRPVRRRHAHGRVGPRLRADGLAEGVRPAAGPRVRRRAVPTSWSGQEKTDRGIYFDFLEFERNIQKNQTPNTPAVSLLYALAEQVAYIEAEGIDARLERHRRMAERTWAWCEERGLTDPGAPGLPFAHRDDRPTVPTAGRARRWRRP
jgi:aspartate aminotransferase-like enzyme